jgi:hypothetical protein
MALQRKYTAAWLLWFAWFAVVETCALLNEKAGDTLSEHGWDWGSFKAKAKAWRLRRIAFVVLLGWLLLHIVTGGWI